MVTLFTAYNVKTRSKIVWQLEEQRDQKTLEKTVTKNLRKLELDENLLNGWVECVLQYLNPTLENGQGNDSDNHKK